MTHLTNSVPRPLMPCHLIVNFPLLFVNNTFKKEFIKTYKKRTIHNSFGHTGAHLAELSAFVS